MEPDRNSAAVWWPKTKDLAIPQPKTVFIPVDRRHISFEGDDTPEAREAWTNMVMKLRVVAESFGYPIFLRTDLASGKQRWAEACFVEDDASLESCLSGVLEFNEMATVVGLPYWYLMVREYIPLEAPFKAFRGMPIAKERRYFVRNGEVACHHPYWPAEAIADGTPRSLALLPEDWRTQLRELDREPLDEIRLLGGYARQIGTVLEGYWSVDFAKAQDGTWYFIDAATGDDSYHSSHG